MLRANLVTSIITLTLLLWSTTCTAQTYLPLPIVTDSNIAYANHVLHAYIKDGNLAFVDIESNVDSETDDDIASVGLAGALAQNPGDSGNIAYTNGYSSAILNLGTHVIGASASIGSENSSHAPGTLNTQDPTSYQHTSSVAISQPYAGVSFIVDNDPMNPTLGTAAGSATLSQDLTFEGSYSYSGAIVASNTELYLAGPDTNLTALPSGAGHWYVHGYISQSSSSDPTAEPESVDEYFYDFIDETWHATYATNVDDEITMYASASMHNTTFASNGSIQPGVTPSAEFEFAAQCYMWVSVSVP